MAIKLLSPNLQALLDSNQLRVYTKDGEGGCRKLINWTFAWIYSGNKSKALVLFDKDEPGEAARKEIVDNSIFSRKDATSKITVKTLECTEKIISIKSKHIEVPFEIEHLLSADFWKLMKEKGYTEQRATDELVKMVGKSLPADKSILQYLTEKIPDNEILESVVLNTPKSDKKDKIATLLSRCPEEDQTKYMEDFKPTIEMIEKMFIDSRITT